MQMFTWEQNDRSRRSPVLARNVVATSQPLAAQAGLEMLRAGGNAVDAAVATAIALTLVEPTSNGIGSDAFAIVWDGKELHGLNGSGRSPAGWTWDFFSKFEAMPTTGWHSVTVPGAASAWVALSERFGRLPFEKLFEPAIAYAREGFAVSPIIARSWREQAEQLREFEDFAQTFLIEGRAPWAGDVFRLPEAVKTLRAIAQSKGESFYRGTLAKAIVKHARNSGGLMTLDDLASHQPVWVTPISIDYRGVTLLEIPPNGQGLAALLALGMLEGFQLDEMEVDSVDGLHLQIEAMKLALADARRYVADPESLDCEPGRLLDRAYLAERAKLIDPRRAGAPTFGVPPRGGTVHLATADASGMMVSFIQSNYAGFGSGIVVPGTGISLQNRGSGFVLDRDHPNCVGPRKRPYHTIIPAFVMREGKPLMAFGVMGGSMQPQGHVQIMTRIFDWKQNPQAAVDAPRWRVMDESSVLVEEGTSAETVEELVRRGHSIVVRPFDSFGGAQMIYRLDNGHYLAASDPRKDGQAVGF